MDILSAQDIIEVVLGPRLFEYREDLGLYHPVVYAIDHMYSYIQLRIF